MDNTEAVKEVIQNYFDGCYFNDGEKIDKAFHKVAHIYGLDEDGKLIDWHRDHFLSMVGAPRPEGYKRDHTQQDEILSLDFTGEHTACARVRLRVGRWLYTDVLCLLCLDGKWGIIAKMLSGVDADSQGTDQ